MFLAVKGKATLSFLLQFAQLHRDHVTSQETQADPNRGVVTPWKNCFRSLNFSFPKLVARNPFIPQLCLHTLDAKSGSSATKHLLLFAVVACPTWPTHVLWEFSEVLLRHVRHAATLPSRNQPEPGGTAAPPELTPSTQKTPQEAGTIGQHWTPFSSKGGKPSAKPCSQIPLPAGAGRESEGNRSSFPATLVLALGERCIQRGEIITQPLPYGSWRLSCRAGDGKPRHSARPRAGDCREASNKQATTHSPGVTGLRNYTLDKMFAFKPIISSFIPLGKQGS